MKNWKCKRCSVFAVLPFWYRCAIFQAAVCLLGRLSELNPALVQPRMRRVLTETLSQLTNSGQAKLEQHSARLLTQLTRQSPKFMRPYLGPLLQALLPKLRNEMKVRLSLSEVYYTLLIICFSMLTSQYMFCTQYPSYVWLVERRSYGI